MFLSAFEVFPEDYLQTLLDVSDMPCFKESFDIAFKSNPSFVNHTLEELVYMAKELPREVGILTVFDREETDE